MITVRTNRGGKAHEHADPDGLVDGFFSAADEAENRLEDQEETICSDPPTDVGPARQGQFEIRRFFEREDRR